MRRASVLSLLGAVGLSAGCTLQPAYQRPAMPVPEGYPTGPAYAEPAAAPSGAQPAADVGWRDFLADPRLQRLVEIAVANNRDLRVAALTVAQFQAQYRIQRSAIFPQVSATASETATRAPLGGVGRNYTTHEYFVGGSASWELDLFGRLRSLNEQALQQYFATAQARKAAQISLVAAVADQYLAILADDSLLAVTERTLQTAQASYELTLIQFQAGTGNELSVRQAQTVVEQAKANYAAQLRIRAQDENELVLLLGQSPPPDLPTPAPLDSQGILTDIPAGLPSDLLARRPDIMEAEDNLRAANANIGAARAAFYPSITLTGTLGTQSLALSALFGPGSLAWSFVPTITLPIFQGGRLRASLDAATIGKEIEIAQYEKTIQTAFREVSDGLAARGTYGEEVAALERLADAYQIYLDLAQLRFRAGIDSYLNVLTAQTNLYTAQQSLVQARLARLTNLVDLYRALGGGWIERTGDTPGSPDDVSAIAATGASRR